MGFIISSVLLLFILCFACACVGYERANRRVKQLEQRMTRLKMEVANYRDLLSTERLRFETEHQKRIEDVEDYNELVDKYNKLYRQYRNMNYGGAKSQAEIHSPLVKEMLRFAMTQAHPDAGKEQTSERFIKYREEYERLYKGRR